MLQGRNIDELLSSIPVVTLDIGVLVCGDRTSVRASRRYEHCLISRLLRTRSQCICTKACMCLLQRCWYLQLLQIQRRYLLRLMSTLVAATATGNKLLKRLSRGSRGLDLVRSTSLLRREYWKTRDEQLPQTEQQNWTPEPHLKRTGLLCNARCRKRWGRKQRRSGTLLGGHLQ